MRNRITVGALWNTSSRQFAGERRRTTRSTTGDVKQHYSEQQDMKRENDRYRANDKYRNKKNNQLEMEGEEKERKKKKKKNERVAKRD